MHSSWRRINYEVNITDTPFSALVYGLHITMCVPLPSIPACVPSPPPNHQTPKPHEAIDKNCLWRPLRSPIWCLLPPREEDTPKNRIQLKGPGKLDQVAEGYSMRITVADQKWWVAGVTCYWARLVPTARNSQSTGWITVSFALYIGATQFNQTRGQLRAKRWVQTQAGLCYFLQ